jgi:hypothetical protein
MVSVVAEKSDCLVDNVVGGVEKPGCSDHHARKAVLKRHMVLIGLVKVRYPTSRINEERWGHSFLP